MLQREPSSSHITQERQRLKLDYNCKCLPMDPDKDKDNRFTTNSFYCANTAKGIIGVISVWFIPRFRIENRNSKIVALFASDEAILLTNACLTNLVSTVNVDIITIEVSVTENESAHFIDKETESVMEDSQTIKAKQRSETEASKNLNESILAHEQENTTSKQSEGLQEPTDSCNSEVYNNKVEDLKAEADKSSEQGKMCKVDNKSNREYAKLEFKCTKLNNKVLSMREELLKFKMENQDLQKQLKDISISIANTYISPNKLQLWHTKSIRSEKATKNGSQTAENDSDKSTKLHKEITLTKQRPRTSKEIEPFFDFKANISSDHNLSAYLKRSFYKQLKTNVRGRFIPWLWECRGDPTNLISY